MLAQIADLRLCSHMSLRRYVGFGGGGTTRPFPKDGGAETKQSGHTPRIGRGPQRIESDQRLHQGI